MIINELANWETHQKKGQSSVIENTLIGIYIIKNKINSKIYVGQTTNYYRRIIQHKSRYKRKEYREYSRIYKAIQKYGIENFDFKFIEHCHKSQLNEREIYWIKFYDSYNNGYNATKGGNNPIAYWKGKKRSVETNKKIANKLTGGKLPEVQKKKISNTMKKVMIGNENGNKKVVCIELGIVFKSIKDASEKLNVNRSSISRVLKGHLKRAGGYHWKYFSNQETIPNGSTVEDELPLEAQNIL